MERSSPVTLADALTGSATAGSDYTVTGQVVTIPAGQLSTNITVTIPEGETPENEDDETVDLGISGAVNGTLGTSAHTLTITVGQHLRYFLQKQQEKLTKIQEISQ